MSDIPIQKNDETVCILLERVGYGGIKVLLYLLKHEESNKNQMRVKAEMGPNSLEGTIHRLHVLELVAEKEGRGTEMLYSLTDKGKKVAESLDTAERILSEGA
jgi:DNA-binding HxlR family transcriptional regulator